MIPNPSSQSGYIALISAMIIAGVLMVIVFTLSFKGFMTRFNLLDTEYKKRSLNLAEACANTGVLRVIENSSYSGETIVFGDEECILTATHPGSHIIHAKASVPKDSSKPAVSNIEVILSPTLSITEWKEVPNF